MKDKRFIATLVFLTVGIITAIIGAVIHEYMLVAIGLLAPMLSWAFLGDKKNES